MTRGFKPLKNPAPPKQERGTGLCVTTHKLARHGDLLGLDDLGLVTREPVKDSLRCHRALGELGQVPALEVLGDPVVESPESAALELLMARVAELLHRLVDGTRRKRAHLSEIDNQVGSRLLGDLTLLVGSNPIAHVNPVRSHATNGRRKHRVQIPKDVDGVTASELHI